MKTISTIIILIFFVGCSTKYPYCIGENNKELEISWGTIYKTQNVEERYLLTSIGTLYKIGSNNRKEKIRTINEKSYCNILERVNNTILKTQAINEVGDTLNFVEYKNPKLGIFFSAKWHPRFNTKNSIYFRELFDSLKVWSLEIKH